ncbi:MAG: hypothetical protein GQ581_06225 [Methyloprofundus sp.]|nr:hypothetical protein [Methyloprofundus sp.]
MNYTEILEELNKATLFDLHRLQSAIYQELKSPARNEAIKFRLKPGQGISYFDSDANCLIDAIVIKPYKTRCDVRNVKDGKRWSIPFYYINLDDVDAAIQQAENQVGIARASLQVGQRVGFKNKVGEDLYGEVIRLNPKTATIKVESGQWRVAYSFLFQVIDGEQAVNSQGQEFLPSLDED